MLSKSKRQSAEQVPCGDVTLVFTEPEDPNANALMDAEAEAEVEGDLAA